MAKMYIYDEEVYPNYFQVCLKDRTTKELLDFKIGEVADWREDDFGPRKVHIFNDLDQIIDLFNNKQTWFVGFNSFRFDDPIINMLIEEYHHLKTISPSQIAYACYELAESIIKVNSSEYKYRNYFSSLDMMRMGRKGNQRKSLKAMAVNLKHDLIQDLPIPPGSEIRFDQIGEMTKYCFNDVEITDKLCDKFWNDIMLRKQISKYYNHNIMNAAGESGIAKELMAKMLCDSMGGISRAYLNNMSTPRTKIELKECIPDYIKFKSKQMRRVLKELSESTITDKEKLNLRTRLRHTYYDIKVGGLHSVNKGELWEANNEYEIIDCDVSSFYPFIIINNNLEPEHLKGHFDPVYGGVVRKRMASKKLMNHYKSIREKELEEEQKLKAGNLKIIANATYGQTGEKFSFLYDLKLMYTVTITGQLSLLMLIERLEAAGIRVFYANTDGITAYVHKDKIQTYYSICKTWENDCDFELEYANYKKCIIRDVNNYLMIKETNGKPLTKWDVKTIGIFDPDAWEDISNKKKFDKPIVARALYNYYVNGTPVKETIESCNDLHDFCMSQKFGPTFDEVVFEKLNYDTNQIERTDLQRTNRYFVTGDTRKGGVLWKVKLDDNGNRKKGTQKVCAGELLIIANDMNQVSTDVKPKYSWYIKECMKIQKLFEGQQNLFG